MSIKQLSKLLKCGTRYEGVHRYSTNLSPAMKPDWNRAVYDAERIIGSQTSPLKVFGGLGNELTGIAMHARKLIGSPHPLLTHAK